MESFGEKLRATRENLGYSIEQIARDTHIAKRYLIALEDEDFSIFPGETYLKGFLQNYSEYLGLDAEVMIDIYRNMKIQEQPMPLDQLLDKKAGARRIPIVIAAVVGALLVAGFVIVLVTGNPLAGNAGPGEDEAGRPYEYLYEGKGNELYAFKGFVVKVPLNNAVNPVTLQKISDSAVTLGFLDGTVDLRVGEEKHLDLDRDGRNDVAFVLKEIFTEQNQRKARLTVQPPAVEGAGEIAANASDVELIARGLARVIREENAAGRFSVDVTVVRNCFVVFYLDKNTREEKVGYKGDTFSLSADQAVDLRVSDGGAVRLRIAGTELEAGRPGEIFAGRIKWVNGGDGRFKLVLIPVK